MQAIVTAYAKINLLLDVLHKREDGYHEVAMIMQAVDLADRISITPAKHNGLKTNQRHIPRDMSNLAMKAVALLQQEFPQLPPLEVKLDKKIPVSAGLAGGSTDCAGVFLGVNQLFQLGLSQSELEIMAAQLGSDVPFCIGGPTALATGRGELIQPLAPCPELWFVLVKPKFGISTAAAYKKLKIDEIKCHPDIQTYMQAMENEDVDAILSGMGNVMESGTHPYVTHLKQELRSFGGEHTMMSGSGPTVFSVFQEKSKAQEFYRKARRRYANVFLTKTVDGQQIIERVQIR